MNTDENVISGSRCAICLESLNVTADHAAKALNCGHVFGRSCIIEWTAIKPTCPLCRGNVTRRELKEFEELQVRPDHPLSKRYVKLALGFALFTMHAYPFSGRFYGTVRLVSTVTPMVLFHKTLNAFHDWRRGEGSFRELIIEQYTPVIDSLIGIAAGLAISSVLM